jgi:hypothetical protein
MEVKPAEFARLSGVSRQSINGKIKNKTLILNSAGMLDTENPVNAAYMSKHGRAGGFGGGFGNGYGYFSGGGQQTGPPGIESPAGPEPGAAVLQTGAAGSKTGDGGDLLMSKAAGVPAQLLDLTLRELVTRYGGNLQNLEKHAKVLRDLTMASEKEQRIQERRLALIEKDFVVSRLFQFIDVLMKQLLEYHASAAVTITATVLSFGVVASMDAERAVDLKLKNDLETIISGAKQQILAELNGLKSKYQGPEDRVEALVSAMEEASLE